MASSKVQRVPVHNMAAMDQVITSFVAQGYTLVSKSETGALLQKKKEFKTVWAIVGFVLCVLPLLIYLIVYATQPDVEVVQIEVTGSEVAQR